MKSCKAGFTAVTLLLLFSAYLSNAQKNYTIDKSGKDQIIRKAVSILYENYIYPDRVKHLETYLLSKIKNGGFDHYNSSETFLSALNADLEREGKDHHLDIFFGPQRVKQIQAEKENPDREVITDDWLRRMKYENFRLRTVERLDGNIGYFRFLNFPPLAPSRESLTAAMNFIRHSYALIIDLRENGGGYAATMNFMLGYFLKDSLPLSDMYYRKGNRIEKTFVLKDSSIQKIPDQVPVYILVSSRTSSAAEGFAGILQQYKRAVVIGEQTKGEGNPGELFIINDSMYMMIPTIESRSPLTGKGTDGIGVIPDMLIDQDKALSRALLESCKSLAAAIPERELKQLYEWMIPYWENELNPAQLSREIIDALVGEYEEGRQIIYENGNLLYINSKGNKATLRYMGRGLFQHSETKWLRLQIPTPDSPVREFNWIWDDGGKETVRRVIK